MVPEIDNAEAPKLQEQEDFGIRIFFPMLGGITVVISLGFLYFFFATLKNPSRHQELAKIQDHGKPGETADTELAKEAVEKPRLLMVFYTVVFMFFFFYV